MKIKTKHMSYDEVANLRSWERKKPRKPSKILAGIARIALQGELKEVGFTVRRSTWIRREMALG